jgi:hypothetical protein
MSSPDSADSRRRIHVMDGLTNRLVSRGDVVVTADDHYLFAWRCIGYFWHRIAIRAGGANQFGNALNLRDSAVKWLEELERNERL